MLNKLGDLQNQIRHGLLLLGLLISAPGLTATVCNGQPPGNVEQRQLEQMIRETQESLAVENWLEAAERLDRAWLIACEKEDPLMMTTGADVRQLAPGETESLPGGKTRLDSLFHNSPAEFQTEFLRQFSDLADTQINAAIKAGDFDELWKLTIRHSFCPAARRGLSILAKRSMDRGDSLDAAMLLGRLQRMNKEPDPSLWLQMAVCYARNGLQNDAMDLVRRVQSKTTNNSIRISGKDVRLPESAAETVEWLASHSGVSHDPVFDWLQPGGSYRRLATQPLSPPQFGSAWKSNLFEVQDVLYSEQYNPILKEYREPIEQEALRLLQRNSTIVPTASPLVTGQLAIIRTPFGVRAVNLQSGELEWEVTRPDSQLKVIIDEQTKENAAKRNPRLGRQFQYTDPRAHLLYQMIRTNTATQMAVNKHTLFVVDESSGATWNDEFGYSLGADMNAAITANFVRAYDVDSGVFKWEVGGQTQNASLPVGRGNLLAGFYFLGAPLILGERTYVLAESGEGIFLIQIAEPHAAIDDLNGSDSDSKTSVNPQIVRSQILTVPQYKLPRHPVRKHAGLVPSFAQGLLICPTCDERIVAVSAEDQSLRWVFRYAGNIRTQELGGDNLVLFGGRDAIDTKSVDMDSRWIDSLPRIIDGRILVTPRDSDQLFCLDLQTGAELWKTPRSAFHAIGAVTNDRVILVGNQRTTALSIVDGTELWSTEIRDGVVCGTSTTDGNVIQIPTDEPAIVTLDLQTGRRLIRQSEDLEKMPGNLLMTPYGLLSQNLSAVTFSASKTGEGKPTIVAQATELLLNRKTEEANELLDRETTSTPQDSAARQMLIELLLEGLRFDFRSNQASIPRLRKLIDKTAADIAIAPLLHTLFGMNPPDAALLPRQLRGRADRYQGELSELIAKGMESSQNSSVEELTENIRQLLNELPAARRQAVGSGFLIRSKATILSLGIRQAMQSRSAEEKRLIQVNLQDTARDIFRGLPDAESQRSFLSGLLNSDLPELMLATIEETSAPGSDNDKWLLKEFAQLEISQSQSVNAGTVAIQMLESWKSAGDNSAVRAWMTDMAVPAAANSSQRFQMSDVAQREKLVTKWNLANPEFSKPAKSIWAGSPTKEESAARTMLEMKKSPDGIPDKFIPLYGPPGIFRNWSFARVRPAGELHAFDADGVVRWKLRPFGVADDANYGFAVDSYVLAYGHLVLINLGGTLFAVDPANLNADGEPQELWRKNIERLSSDPGADQYRDYVPPADRVPQYFPQPAAYYPVGPVTSLGIPVISGRRLALLDPLTGERNWQLDGIARDAVLLCSGDSLLILSEGSRQIEVRSLVDGSLRSVSRLPEWWGEANANVGSSIRDIEVEEGVEFLWRIVLQDQSCLLFRLNKGRAALESRDLLTDTANWTIDLPEDTVFSNVDHDVVALLCEGKQLKLVQTDTGRILADVPVTAVTNARELVLRYSAGHYVVLPESVDDGTLDYDPVIDAMHVYGRVYSIREDTMSLAWDNPLDHRHIRLATPDRSVLLPNVPLLLLLSRGGDVNPKSPIRRTHYGARVIDVRTGKDLYLDEDVGTTLNNLWLHIDAQTRKLQLSFDSRIISFDYPESQQD